MIAHVAVRVVGLVLWSTILATPTTYGQIRGVYDRVPDSVDREARYVIYLHGRIIEEQGRRPTHPAWGTYEYQQILDTLAENDLVVISEQRPPETDMDLYARHVAGQIRELMSEGIPSESISVIGFSKGGGIAMRTAALVENRSLNVVLLAACGDGDFSGSSITVLGANPLGVRGFRRRRTVLCVTVREIRWNRRARRNRDRCRRWAWGVLPAST